MNICEGPTWLDITVPVGNIARRLLPSLTLALTCSPRSSGISIELHIRAFAKYYSAGDPKAKNFHPVTSLYGPGEQFGKLDEHDLDWTCAGGFVSEVQIFYQFNPDGTFIMLQVIHASVG